MLHHRTDLATVALPILQGLLASNHYQYLNNPTANRQTRQINYKAAVKDSISIANEFIEQINAATK